MSSKKITPRLTRLSKLDGFLNHEKRKIINLFYNVSENHWYHLKVLLMKFLDSNFARS